MRGIGLALLLLLTGAAPPTSPDRWITWSADQPPLTLRDQGVVATIRAGACEPGAKNCELVTPLVEVRAPGASPVRITGDATPRSMPHAIGIGRLAKSDTLPSVVFAGYTGGAHCCQHLQVATPVAGRMRVVDLGAWDGDTMDWPRDLSGDGIADFALVDNAFLYAFGCYACSYAPPQVLTIRQGRKVDISGEVVLRPLFSRDAARVRPLCRQGDRAACAAYAADAARLGRIGPAWREILRVYSRTDPWPLPTGCRQRAKLDDCPEGQAIRYAGYPQALAAFLKARGYVPHALKLPMR